MVEQSMVEAISCALPGLDAMIANIDRWRETGQVATADESKALYEGLLTSRAMLSAALPVQPEKAG